MRKKKKKTFDEDQTLTATGGGDTPADAAAEEVAPSVEQNDSEIGIPFRLACLDE